MLEQAIVDKGGGLKRLRQWPPTPPSPRTHGSAIQQPGFTKTSEVRPKPAKSGEQGRNCRPSETSGQTGSVRISASSVGTVLNSGTGKETVSGLPVPQGKLSSRKSKSGVAVGTGEAAKNIVKNENSNGAKHNAASNWAEDRRQGERLSPQAGTISSATPMAQRQSAIRQPSRLPAAGQEAPRGTMLVSAAPHTICATAATSEIMPRNDFGINTVETRHDPVVRDMLTSEAVRRPDHHPMQPPPYVRGSNLPKLTILPTAIQRPERTWSLKMVPSKTVSLPRPRTYHGEETIEAMMLMTDLQPSPTSHLYQVNLPTREMVVSSQGVLRGARPHSRLVSTLPTEELMDTSCGSEVVPSGKRSLKMRIRKALRLTKTHAYWPSGKAGENAMHKGVGCELKSAKEVQTRIQRPTTESADKENIFVVQTSAVLPPMEPDSRFEKTTAAASSNEKETRLHSLERSVKRVQKVQVAPKSRPQPYWKRLFGKKGSGVSHMNGETEENLSVEDEIKDHEKLDPPLQKKLPLGKSKPPAPRLWPSNKARKDYLHVVRPEGDGKLDEKESLEHFEMSEKTDSDSLPGQQKDGKNTQGIPSIADKKLSSANTRKSSLGRLSLERGAQGYRSLRRGKYYSPIIAQGIATYESKGSLETEGRLSRGVSTSSVSHGYPGVFRQKRQDSLTAKSNRLAETAAISGSVSTIGVEKDQSRPSSFTLSFTTEKTMPDYSKTVATQFPETVSDLNKTSKCRSIASQTSMSKSSNDDLERPTKEAVVEDCKKKTKQTEHKKPSQTEEECNVKKTLKSLLQPVSSRGPHTIAEPEPLNHVPRHLRESSCSRTVNAPEQEVAKGRKQTTREAVYGALNLTDFHGVELGGSQSRMFHQGKRTAASTSRIATTSSKRLTVPLSLHQTSIPLSVHPTTSSIPPRPPPPHSPKPFSYSAAKSTFDTRTVLSASQISPRPPQPLYSRREDAQLQVSTRNAGAVKSDLQIEITSALEPLLSPALTRTTTGITDAGERTANISDGKTPRTIDAGTSDKSNIPRKQLSQGTSVSSSNISYTTAAGVISLPADVVSTLPQDSLLSRLLHDATEETAITSACQPPKEHVRDGQSRKGATSSETKVTWVSAINDSKKMPSMCNGQIVKIHRDSDKHFAKVDSATCAQGDKLDFRAEHVADAALGEAVGPDPLETAGMTDSLDSRLTNSTTCSTGTLIIKDSESESLDPSDHSLIPLFLSGRPGIQTAVSTEACAKLKVEHTDYEQALATELDDLLAPCPEAADASRVTSRTHPKPSLHDMPLAVEPPNLQPVFGLPPPAKRICTIPTAKPSNRHIAMGLKALQEISSGGSPKSRHRQIEQDPAVSPHSPLLRSPHVLPSDGMWTTSSSDTSPKITKSPMRYHQSVFDFPIVTSASHFSSAMTQRPPYGGAPQEEGERISELYGLATRSASPRTGDALYHTYGMISSPRIAAQRDTFQNSISFLETGVGVYDAPYLSSKWIFNECDEQEMAAINLEAAQIEFIPGCEDTRRWSTESTSSEKEFRERYSALRKAMLCRKSIPLVCDKPTYSISHIDKTVLVHRTSNGYGFRIHGDHPVVVAEVDSGGAADEAGLDVGDVIINLNGINVLDMSHTQVVNLALRGTDVLRLDVASRKANVRQLELQLEIQSLSQGYLIVRGGFAEGRKNWKRRWVVLKEDNNLYLYKTSDDKEAVGVIVLENYLITPFGDCVNAFRLSKYGDRTYYFITSSEQDRHMWVDCVKRALGSATEKADPWLSITKKLSREQAMCIESPECAGHLTTQFQNTWHRYYCVLRHACLLLYPEQGSATAVAILHLQGYSVDQNETVGKNWPVILSPPEAETSHSIDIENRPPFELAQFWFFADSAESQKSWITALRLSISRWTNVE